MSKRKDGRRRNAIVIMARLVGLVVPLLPIMLLAIALGVAGFLCAIFLTIVASYEVVSLLAAHAGAQLGTVPLFDAVVAQLYHAGTLLASGGQPVAYTAADVAENAHVVVFTCLVVLGVLRGVLHYYEQYCNHYIAFKLLAIIRHKVFAALRTLAPAKLEGRDKGNLVSIITSDIELLEVFYAHTISPIVIAVLTSGIMVAFISSLAPEAGWLALVAYVVVGVVMPVVVGAAGSAPGLAFRDAFGDLNSFVLDSLRGVDETIQYGYGEQRAAELDERSRDLGRKQRVLNRIEAHQRSFSNLIILLFSLGMLFLMVSLYQQGMATFMQVLVATVAMMGSFGPVLALSNLANTLNQTLACGDRVLDLLDEDPAVREVEGGGSPGLERPFSGASVRDVRFSYGAEPILDGCTLDIPRGSILGIHGASGSGKSTLLKLLMRFWDADSGNVNVSGADVRSIDTADLRALESYVTQETYLFHDTIANNIGIARPGARRADIVDAAQKAALHDFVSSLPQGYDTQVGELGDTLSGGQRQRIGIARAFLHDGPLLLLDEPTSNLDSLNEGIILKSLKEQQGRRTVVLVTHRASTLGIADTTFHMDTGRVS
ncbi:MAG TPA: ABC transporter ATP-binding protein [Eggerthellaceae bacterium]|nr:ABC transporter ATP-binding protein [Eggerthellaceae bacterium]